VIDLIKADGQAAKSDDSNGVPEANDANGNSAGNPCDDNNFDDDHLKYALTTAAVDPYQSSCNLMLGCVLRLIKMCRDESLDGIADYAFIYNMCFNHLTGFLDNFNVGMKDFQSRCLLYGLNLYFCDIYFAKTHSDPTAFCQLNPPTDYYVYRMVILRLLNLLRNTTDSWIELCVKEAVIRVISRMLQCNTTAKTYNKNALVSIRCIVAVLIFNKRRITEIFDDYFDGDNRAFSIAAITYFKGICKTLKSGRKFSYLARMKKEEFLQFQTDLEDEALKRIAEFKDEYLRIRHKLKNSWEYKKYMIKFAAVFLTMDYIRGINICNKTIRSNMCYLLKEILDDYMKKVLNNKTRDKPMKMFIDAFDRLLPIHDITKKEILQIYLNRQE